MHIVQLDTNSLTLAISGDKNRGPEQRFDAVIKYAEFYNKNKGFFFSEDDQRKILGVHIEKQGLYCIALCPRNYIINDECGDVSLVAKDVILRQNPQINEQTFVDNIKQGKVMKITNTILSLKNNIMSKFSMTKNVLLDGLDRCDAKLDARIAGGLSCGTNKKKPECFDDQAPYLRRAGELPKIINKKNLVCFEEAHSDTAFEMRISLKNRILDEIRWMNSECSVENKLHNACDEYREI
ncbi:MAG: hypothetical protein EZS28_038164 [Streblomastix strix]|uniref:Uncharacterized protein n=1 Tax=Streblomastix strix TaxID=222440 RepID=A0A5J4U7H2_9EUKA|nr:MAG: hypothetical protein EZS28_038164 [Streblomastix strix]